MLKKTKKTTSSKTSWKKVWVICGEEYLCKLSILSLTEGMNVTTFYPNDTIENILPHITNFSFLNDQTSIILKEPPITILKAILPFVENNKVAIPSLIVLLSQSDPESGDFIKEAKKNKRIFPHSYISSSDTCTLKRFVIDVWTSKNKAQINQQACTWLIEHAPTKTVKISSKKEEEVFDLTLLNNELCKIASFKSNISMEDITDYCVFDQTTNIWDCVNSLLFLGTNQAFNQYKNYLQYNNIKLLINILTGQLKFIIEVQSLYKQGIKNPVDIQKALSYSTFVDQYPGIECKENSGGIPNFWRIKKTLEKIHTYDATVLTRQLNALHSANIDLQAGGDQLLITDYLFFALKGNAKYNEPFFI